MPQLEGEAEATAKDSSRSLQLAAAAYSRIIHSRVAITSTINGPDALRFLPRSSPPVVNR
jgi:hypothetical protein